MTSYAEHPINRPADLRRVIPIPMNHKSRMTTSGRLKRKKNNNNNYVLLSPKVTDGIHIKTAIKILENVTKHGMPYMKMRVILTVRINRK